MRSHQGVFGRGRAEMMLQGGCTLKVNVEEIETKSYIFLKRSNAVMGWNAVLGRQWLKKNHVLYDY
jgi:hypothetical protein